MKEFNINLSKDYLINEQGQKVFPCEMMNDKLLNTINFLEENAEKLKLKADITMLNYLKDDNLILCFGEETIKECINNLWRRPTIEWLETAPIYEALYREIEKRNLLDFLVMMREAR